MFRVVFVVAVASIADEVALPIEPQDNSVIAKYMRQRQQLLKDAQDNKNKVEGRLRHHLLTPSLIFSFLCDYTSPIRLKHEKEKWGKFSKKVKLLNFSALVLKMEKGCFKKKYMKLMSAHQL